MIQIYIITPWTVSVSAIRLLSQSAWLAALYVNLQWYFSEQG